MSGRMFLPVILRQVCLYFCPYLFAMCIFLLVHMSVNLGWVCLCLLVDHWMFVNLSVFVSHVTEFEDRKVWPVRPLSGRSVYCLAGPSTFWPVRLPSGRSVYRLAGPSTVWPVRLLSVRSVYCLAICKSVSVRLSSSVCLWVFVPDCVN